MRDFDVIEIKIDWLCFYFDFRKEYRQTNVSGARIEGWTQTKYGAYRFNVLIGDNTLEVKVDPAFGASSDRKIIEHLKYTLKSKVEELLYFLHKKTHDYMLERALK